MNLPAAIGKSPAAFLNWVARMVLAGVFLYAGVEKLAHPVSFHQDVLNFQWMQDPLAAWMALVLPPLEVSCAVAILVPGERWSRSASLVLAILLMGFLAALTRAWRLGLDIHCGCFGPSDDPINYPLKIAQDSLFLVAALMVLFRNGDGRSLPLP